MRPAKKVILYFFSLFFFSISPFISSAFAQNIDRVVNLTKEEREWVSSQDPIIVGAGIDWAPFDFVIDSGEYGGLAWDYLQEIGQRTGLNFQAEVAPWHINVEKAKTGEVDVLPGVFVSEERQKFFLFSQPYYKTVEYFFIRDDIDASSVLDLDGLRAAIPRDYAHIEFLEAHYPKIEIVLVDTIGEAIDAVIQGDADLLYETYVTVDFLLEREGIKSIKPFLSSRGQNEESVHFAVNKNLPLLHSILDKGLAAITLEQRRAINQRWLSREVATRNPVFSLTQKEVEWLSSRKELRFGGDPNWLPYEAFDENGQYIGIVSDYLSLIEQRLGTKFNRVETSTWDQTISYLKNGKLDIISETSDSPLEQYVEFTSSYLSSPIVIVMRDDNSYVESIDQIKRKKIALIKSYGYINEIKKSYPQIPFESVNNIQEGLTGVSTGKVDALIATLAQVSYHISDLGMHNVRIVGQTEFQTKLSFGVRKDYAPLIPIMNRAIDSISANERQKVLDTWGKEKFASRADYTFVWRVVFISAVVLLAILIWNRKLAQEIKLRKQAEDQTKKLIDNIPAQVFVTDLNGLVLTYNPQFKIDYGFQDAELENFNVDDLYTDFADKEDIANTLLKGDQVKNKVIKLCKKGQDTVHSLMLSVITIRYSNKPALLAIAVDLNERLEIEAQLMAAKEAAEVATRSKSEFLANMSHEIRTPMNAIVGFTDLLEQKIEDEKLLSYIRTIQSSSNNLLLIVNDILDLSKIEAGAVHIEKSPARPAILFEELYDIFKLSAREKDLDIYFDISTSIPEVLYLDLPRLRQVLINLLGNAIKFTDVGHIKLSVGVDGVDELRSKLNLRIDVEDTGLGIPDEEIEDVFDKFHQVTLIDGVDRGGTGLGLSICQRMVKLMGGDISVKSTENIGTTFSIHLKDVDVIAVSELPESKREQTAKYQMEFKPAVVLTVDDIDVNRVLVAELLKESNLKVLQASNGLEAIEQVENNHVDLVLMDLRMPVMSGYDAAKEIKANTDLTIIALTASVMKQELDKISTSYFDDYLRKPVSKEALISKLSEFLPHTLIKREEVENEKDETEHVPLPEKVKQDLRPLRSQIRDCLVDNNISEISVFAENLSAVARKHEFELLIDLSDKLRESASIFDISAMNERLGKIQKVFDEVN